MKGLNDAGFYHVCTDGSAIKWMFQDDKDFIAGVNRIAICHLIVGVSVMAYVLMDTHVHFVLYGTRLQCKEFINMYKRLTGKWIRTRYGISDHLRLLPTEVMCIDNEEQLLNTLAYLDRNPVVAGYKYLAGEYPWGSARFIFKSLSSGQFSWPLSSLTKREQRSLLGTRVNLPEDWSVDDCGMVSPLSFLDVQKLESYFKTPARYSYFLAKKLEGLVEQGFVNSQKVFMPDKEMRPIVRKLVKELYGMDDIRELDFNMRLSVARKLRYGYASTIKQISRMVHLDKSVLEGFL